MKNYKITFKRLSGKVDFEIIKAKNEKSAEKKYWNTIFYCELEVLSIELI